VWLLLAKGDTMGIKISKGQRDKGQIHQLAFWHLAFQNPYSERDKMPNAKCQWTDLSLVLLSEIEFIQSVIANTSCIDLWLTQQ